MCCENQALMEEMLTKDLLPAISEYAGAAADRQGKAPDQDDHYEQ